MPRHLVDSRRRIWLVNVPRRPQLPFTTTHQCTGAQHSNAQLRIVSAPKTPAVRNALVGDLERRRS
jgi:hypothetical protein